MEQTVPRKLTQSQADEIRELYDRSYALKYGDPNKWTYQKLSEKFGVHISTVWCIANRRTYKDGH